MNLALGVPDLTELRAWLDNDPALRTFFERIAREREEVLDYDEALRVWERLGDVAAQRRLRQQMRAELNVHVAEKIVHGDDRTTTVRDSVINRSAIGVVDDLIGKLRELHALREAGVLDDAQFEAVKQVLLK